SGSDDPGRKATPPSRTADTPGTDSQQIRPPPPPRCRSQGDNRGIRPSRPSAPRPWQEWPAWTSDSFATAGVQCRAQQVPRTVRRTVSGGRVPPWFVVLVFLDEKVGLLLGFLD